MNTQSIIVYRNPLEAAMWENLMNGGFTIFFIVMLLGVLWVLIYMGVEKLRRKLFKRRVFSFVPFKSSWAGAAEMWTASIITLAAAIGLHFYNIYG